MKFTVLLFLFLSVTIAKAEDGNCYFHYSNSDKALLNYSHSDSSLFVNFNIDENLEQYDGVRLKFFGTKRENKRSENLFKTHDLATDFLRQRKTGHNSYKLVALNKKGTNIWLSEIGLERIRFLKFNHIRVEVHLLKEKGLTGSCQGDNLTKKVAYFEHHVSCSDWLNVKDVKRTTKPKKKRAVFPIVAFSGLGVVMIGALVSQ